LPVSKWSRSGILVIDCDRRDYSTIDRDHDRDRAQPYCIAPDLCRKNCCVSFYAGCWLRFHSSSTSQQSKWLCVCFRDYHDVTSLPANSYVSAWLSVNHWWHQLLSQSWVARVWCLWTLAQWLMAASTMMNCCCNDCCQQSTMSN